VPTHEACVLVQRCQAWGTAWRLLFLPRAVIVVLVAGLGCLRTGPTNQLSKFDRSLVSPTPTDQPRDAPTALAWLLTVVTRRIFGLRKCLFESVVVGRALVSMGYRPRIVVGHNYWAGFGSAPMHAWIEIDGSAVCLPDHENRLQYHSLFEWNLSSRR
jgi:hypothetical protein